MANLPSSVPPDVLNALRSGNQLEAIKLLRKTKGIGLMEAKATLDAFLRASAAGNANANAGAKPKPQPHAVTMQSRHTFVSPRRAGEVANYLSPGEVPRESAGTSAFVILVAAAVAAVFWLK